MSAALWAGMAGMAMQLAAPARDGFDVSSLAFSGEVLGLAPLDLDGDGKLELLIARKDALVVVPFAAGGEAAPLLTIPLGKSRTLAWCITPALPSEPRGDAILTLRDDGVVERTKAGVPPRELVRVPGVVLPTGVYSFPFARDLNGDGVQDLALPALAGLELHFIGADGVVRAGPVVRHRIDLSLDLPGFDDDAPSVAASINIPSFEVKDQNGDGRPDLAFQSEDHLQFFWSDSKGALPESPTLDVDLGELRAKLEPRGGSMLDTSNLLKGLSGQVNALVRDLDRDGCADLLLRQGSKVSLFAGTASGIDRAKAVQVLKVSGNLLTAFATDDNGDGKQDLCLVQVADVSIGEVLLWVIAGGSVKLDLYSYFQEETLRFSKSPSRRRRLVIDVPPILGIADELEGSPAIQRLVDEFARLPVALDLDGDGVRSDVADLRRDGTIALHRGVMPHPIIEELEASWRAGMERFDREADGKDAVTVDLLDLVDWVPTPGAALRHGIAGRTADVVLGTPDPNADKHPKVAGEPDTGTDWVVIALDVDGDQKDDLLVYEPDPLRITLYRTK